MSEKDEFQATRSIHWSFLTQRGVRYLSRYPASEKRFRTTMRRALAKRCQKQEVEWTEAFELLLDALTDYARNLGYLNDTALAQGLITSYRRRGDSWRMVRQKLAQKGVPSMIVEAALAAEQPDAELEAARLYAQKKKLGIYGSETDFASRQRSLQRMARRGFSYGVARKALDGDVED